MNLGTAFHALGITLHAQGAEESARARLEDAVFIYHEALQELTRERVPLQWAMTQMNLGYFSKGWPAGERADAAGTGRRRLS